MTKIEAEKLREQKDNLQMMIYNCVSLKQDAKQLVIEYHKIADMLVKNGYKVYIRAPYLKLDYWGLVPNDIYNSTINEPKMDINEIKTEIKYVLNLAWTGEANSCVDRIKEYLEENLDFLCEDTFENEHVIKYEFVGTQKEFQIYKKSANFILDVLTTDSNIAIYGKQKI